MYVNIRVLATAAVVSLPFTMFVSALSVKKICGSCMNSVAFGLITAIASKIR